MTSREEERVDPTSKHTPNFNTCLSSGMNQRYIHAQQLVGTKPCTKASTPKSCMHKQGDLVLLFPSSLCTENLDLSHIKEFKIQWTELESQILHPHMKRTPHHGILAFHKHTLIRGCLGNSLVEYYEVNKMVSSIYENISRGQVKMY